MRRLAILLFFAALSVPALGQEFTIFDLNDFIDPRELGATITDGEAFHCPCIRFLISRAVVGLDHDFINVMQPTDLDVAFAHVATSYYSGAWQFNVKATVIREVRRPEAAAVSRFSMPHEALALQVGRYVATKEEDNFIIGRYQLSWRVSRYEEPERGNPGGTSSVLTHEFGGEMDIRVGDVVGSLTYTMIDDTTTRLHFSDRPARLAYVYRFDGHQWLGVRVEPTFSLGVLAEGVKLTSHLTLQPSLKFVWPIGETGANLNVRVAPTWQRFGGWHDYYEVSAFVDRHIFVRTW